MSNFGIQEERERIKNKREKLACFFLDMAKLSFAGMVVSCIVSIGNGDNEALSIYKAVAGCILTIAFARIGSQIL